MSPRSRARADEQTFRSLPRRELPRDPRQLEAHEIHVGMRVLARGTLGEVESIAWSTATNSHLYVVAHDPRMRLTYRLSELTAAP